VKNSIKGIYLVSRETALKMHAFLCISKKLLPLQGKCIYTSPLLESSFPFRGKAGMGVG
jgi:hypothetical protein